MLERQGEFKGAGGVRIWYQSWRPQAPKAVIVVVHGLGEHSGRYGNPVGDLVPRGYALYIPDLRGHGRSSGLRGHIDRFADYTADLLGAIEEARTQEPGLPVFVYGLSLGGLIALRYALERPQGIRGLVISGPALRRKFAVPAGKLVLGRLMSRVWPTFTQHSGLPADRLSHDPQVGAAYVADPLVHDLVTARFFTEVIRTQDEVLASAHELTLPCLFLQAGDDQLVDAQATRELYERAASADKALRWYEGLYHEVHNEAERERVLGDVVEWLDARAGS